MNQKIAFVHVPRTAGTSFRDQLKRSGQRVFMDYGDDPFVAGKHPHYDSIDDVMKSGEFDVVAGHVKASRYADAAKANGWALVTWVRDPLERSMSHYSHWVQQFWLRQMSGATHVEFCEQRPPFMEWLKRPEVIRAMSLQLDVPPKAFDFIGQTEEYESDLCAFNLMYEAELQPSRENADFLKLKLTDGEFEDALTLFDEAGEARAYWDFVKHESSS